MARLRRYQWPMDVAVRRLVEIGGVGLLGVFVPVGGEDALATGALDVADVGGIKAGFFGEFFLGEGFGVALAADISAQGGQNGIKFRHDS